MGCNMIITNVFGNDACLYVHVEVCCVCRRVQQMMRVCTCMLKCVACVAVYSSILQCVTVYCNLCWCQCCSALQRVAIYVDLRSGDKSTWAKIQCECGLRIFRIPSEPISTTPSPQYEEEKLSETLFSFCWLKFLQIRLHSWKIDDYDDLLNSAFPYFGLWGSVVGWEVFLKILSPHSPVCSAWFWPKSIVPTVAWLFNDCRAL